MSNLKTIIQEETNKIKKALLSEAKASAKKSSKTPYEQGWDAYKKDNDVSEFNRKGMKANPFKKSGNEPDEYSEWRDGYKDSRQDTKKWG